VTEEVDYVMRVIFRYGVALVGHHIAEYGSPMQRGLAREVDDLHDEIRAALERLAANEPVPTEVGGWPKVEQIRAANPGISQGKVATMLGVSEKTIRNWARAAGVASW
jgi:DNA-binding transcriptional regulator YiaG